MKIIVEERPKHGELWAISGEASLIYVYEAIMDQMNMIGTNAFEWAEDFRDYTNNNPMNVNEWSDVTQFLLTIYTSDEVQDKGPLMCIGDWLWQYCKRDYFGCE